MIKKKIIIVALLSILLTATFSSVSGIETNSLKANQSLGLTIPIIGSEISINATPSQINQPIDPSGTAVIKVTVKYKLDIGNFVNWFLLKRRIGRFVLFGFGYISKLKPLPSAEIDMTVQQPDWCIATINPSNVSLEISNTFKEAGAEVTFSIVNASAHALELNYITINAEFKQNWRIKGSSNQTSIPFMLAYVSKISAVTESVNYISPINKSIIPINITNNGNGETIVNVQLENQSQNLNISIDQENITLAIGETNQVNLVITPGKNFENETIALKLIPKSTSNANVDNKYLQGTPISLSMTLINNSPKKEEGGISGEILVIAVILAVALIIIVILLLKHKKQ